MSKIVELRPIAITGLNLTFARLMGENKIRHYKIPYSVALMAKMANRTTEEIVSDQVRSEEGPNTEIVFLPQKNTDKQFPEKPTSGQTLQAKDISQIILKDDPKVELALRHRAVKSQIFEYNVQPNPFKRLFLGIPFSLVNLFLINPINSLLFRYQVGKIDPKDRFEYLLEINEFFHVPFLPEYQPHREASPCTYLGVAFEEDDIGKATEALLGDLRLLHSKDLIMGHLSMPILILLADTIGSGKNVYAMFCFVFLDHIKLAKLHGLKRSELPNCPTEILGTKTETLEGGIKYLDDIDPSNKYEIEEIVIEISTALNSEKNRQAYIQNYKENVETVNQIAKKVKENIGNVRVENKTSENLGRNQVLVNADLVGPNGEVTTVEELYRKNGG